MYGSMLIYFFDIVFAFKKTKHFWSRFRTFSAAGKLVEKVGLVASVAGRGVEELPCRQNGRVLLNEPQPAK
jgi:hypothetical protein